MKSADTPKPRVPLTAFTKLSELTLFKCSFILTALSKRAELFAFSVNIKLCRLTLLNSRALTLMVPLTGGAYNCTIANANDSIQNVTWVKIYLWVF